MTLNDLLRTTGIGGDIMMTNGMQALQDNSRNRMINLVRYFEDFNNDNDPY